MAKCVLVKTMKQNKYDIVLVWFDSVVRDGKMKVMACANSLENAAYTMRTLKKPNQSLVVRERETDKHYCYANLVDIWTGKVKQDFDNKAVN